MFPTSMPRSASGLRPARWTNGRGLPGGLSTRDVELVVPALERELAVTITPDKETYAPGELAVFRVEVTRAGGAPADAELSAALVERARSSVSSRTWRRTCSRRSMGSEITWSRLSTPRASPVSRMAAAAVVAAVVPSSSLAATFRTQRCGCRSSRRARMAWPRSEWPCPIT